jgi:RNA polymerase sigma-70 factor, ECF subfamily
MTLTGTDRPSDLQAIGTEAMLMARVRRKDESALREIVAEYGGRVLGVARRTLQDAARAEEVAQDTFVAFWARPDAFDPARGSLRSFLLGIAHHKAVDEVRKQSARDRATARLLAEEELVSEPRGARSPEAGPDVHRALKDLNPKLRETLFLAFFVGLTYREVAVELGIPEGTAKSRIREALQQLRSSLTSVDKAHASGNDVAHAVQERRQQRAVTAAKMGPEPQPMMCPYAHGDERS